MSDLNFKNKKEEKEYYDSLKKRTQSQQVKEYPRTNSQERLSLEDYIKAVITAHSMPDFNGRYELTDFDLDEHIVPMLVRKFRDFKK